MKKYNILFAILALAFASLACQAVMGGGNNGAPTLIPSDDSSGIPTVPPVATDLPTMPAVATDDGSFTFGDKTDFPLPDDAANVVSMGNDIVNFQTKLSLDEGMKFYRDQFGKLGYTERTELTFTAGTTFSMVFDGHKSGKAITVQGVDLGDGTINISITLADI